MADAAIIRVPCDTLMQFSRFNGVCHHYQTLLRWADIVPLPTPKFVNTKSRSPARRVMCSFYSVAELREWYHRCLTKASKDREFARLGD